MANGFSCVSKIPELYVKALLDVRCMYWNLKVPV